MTKILHMDENAAPPMVDGAVVPVTPLAEALHAASNSLVKTRGARTAALFSDAQQELFALTAAAGVFDRGQRVRLGITGEDRVRWLNGMVTNTVKALATGAHHYTFVLNAQGRIQGDASVFALSDRLIVETDRAQAAHLHAHLDRFIIMDDVELGWEESLTSIGIAGPDAATLLAAAGLPVPAAGCFASSPAAHVVCEHSPGVRRYSVWVPGADLLPLWQQLTAAGGLAAGAFAVEALRVLEGTPLYGAEITEKTLAQETGQMHALNFNKGCYLGQEIVERIRSRATVHRGLRQFALTGEPASPGMPLMAGETVVGELTSVAPVALPGQTDQGALGMVRIEALERAETLHYPGGGARLLSPPLLSPASV